MNIHIKSNSYLAVVLAILMFSSCKKFLEEKPTASFSEEAAFSNPNNARAAVLGVYNQLSGDNAYGSRLSLFFPYDNDEMIGSSNYAVPDNSSRDVARYDVLPTHSFLEPTFRRLYTGIERANVCIKNLPAMPAYTTGSDQVKADLKRLHGEALTLRAQLYMELIRIWGDVPAHFVPAADLPELNLPKTDRDVIYDQLLKDLTLAAELMPWRNDPGVAADERLTKGAAKGLRARIALYRGGYSLRRESTTMQRKADYLVYYKIARDECSDIMSRTDKHTLNPSFQAVFKDAILAHRQEPNGEIMFEVAMAGEAFDTDSKLGYYNGPRINGLGNGAMFVLPTYFYAFEPFDKRRDVTVAPYTINASGNKVGQLLSGLYDGKFRRDWISNPDIPVTSRAQYYSINWPILRFSDILLMFAEAENELNGSPTVAAIDAVNAVRTRSWSKGIKKIVVNAQGAGYSAATTSVNITGGGGIGASAVAIVTSGRITAVEIVNVGDGYTSVPNLTIIGAGSGAAAVVTEVSTFADAQLSSAATATKDAFFEAIVKERSLEFGGEGIRKYDLIRWNLLDTKLQEARVNMAKILAKQMPYQNVPTSMYYKTNSTDLSYYNSFYTLAPTSAPGTFTRISWSSTVVAALTAKIAPQFKPNHSELLPIPASAIEANPKLTQDYDY